MLLAATVRSAFGFGEALVAVPLLALTIPVKEAVPVAALASIFVACLVLARDWREVHVRGAAALIASTMLGIPLGLWLLRAAPEPALKGALAVVILAFSAYSLRRRAGARLADDRFAWLFGFAAGVFGGAYGLNGPPLVVYGSLRGWTPARFRATLQAYFLPASLAGMLGFAAAGLWTSGVTALFLWSAPSIVAGALLGGWISRRLEPGRFHRLLHAGLALTGLALLYQAGVRG
jgi:uncharacterized membrane protein YfcA